MTLGKSFWSYPSEMSSSFKEIIICSFTGRFEFVFGSLEFGILPSCFSHRQPLANTDASWNVGDRCHRSKRRDTGTVFFFCFSSSSQLPKLKCESIQASHTHTLTHGDAANKPHLQHISALPSSPQGQSCHEGKEYSGFLYISFGNMGNAENRVEKKTIIKCSSRDLKKEEKKKKPCSCK